MEHVRGIRCHRSTIRKVQNVEISAGQIIWLFQKQQQQKVAKKKKKLKEKEKRRGICWLKILRDRSTKFDVWALDPDSDRPKQKYYL